MAIANRRGRTHSPRPFSMNWIGIITKLLTAVNVIVCVLIILLVLLQRPKNEGLGAAFGGDTASNLFGAQTTNVLATLTRWLGATFLALCMLIAVLGTHDKGRQGKINDFIERAKVEQAQRERQKAVEEAAKAAASTTPDGSKPAVDSSAVTPPVQAPGDASAPATPEKMPVQPAPAPTSPDAGKPAAEKPAEPKTDPAKPAEAKPEAPKPAEPAPAASKPAEPAPAAPESKPQPEAPKPEGN